jgi:hypothetical protein
VIQHFNSLILKVWKHFQVAKEESIVVLEVVLKFKLPDLDVKTF